MQKFIPGVTFLLLCLFSITVPADTPSKNTHQVQQNNLTTCLVCHVDPKISTIFDTPHAQEGDSRTPFANQACETCHGLGLEHPKISFGAKSLTPVDEQNQICLGCHEDDKRIHWSGSTHQLSDLACVSCHVIHAVKDPVMDRKHQNNACYFCHAQQKAQSFMRSRHPLREAIMVCTDCHSPHGSTSESLLAKNTVNETCYTCHTEKRGPFLWEHPPVQENCALCHNPHGSTQDRLLMVRGPFLCQQCHSEAFHQSALFDGSGISSIGAQSRLLAENCLNCHYFIHGSNHPAGVAFDR